MQTLPATEVTHKLVCRLLFMSGRRTLNPYSSKLDKKPKNATPLPTYMYITNEAETNGHEKSTTGNPSDAKIC